MDSFSCTGLAEPSCLTCKEPVFAPRFRKNWFREALISSQNVEKPAKAARFTGLVSLDKWNGNRWVGPQLTLRKGLCSIGLDKKRCGTLGLEAFLPRGCCQTVCFPMGQP